MSDSDAMELAKIVELLSGRTCCDSLACFDAFKDMRDDLLAKFFFHSPRRLSTAHHQVAIFLGSLYELELLTCECDDKWPVTRRGRKKYFCARFHCHGVVQCEMFGSRERTTTHKKEFNK